MQSIPTLSSPNEANNPWRWSGTSNPTIAGSMSISSVAVNNGLNSAWRNAVVHLNSSEGWNDALPYPPVEAATKEMTNVKGAGLRRISPGRGVYFTELDPKYTALAMLPAEIVQLNVNQPGSTSVHYTVAITRILSRADYATGCPIGAITAMALGDRVDQGKNHFESCCSHHVRRAIQCQSVYCCLRSRADPGFEN